MRKVRFIGLDVHSETIAIAVAEPTGEVRALGVIPNREDPIRRMVKKLGPVQNLRACYEAGPTGYVLYWQLTRLGVRCEVVAPTLVPVKAGDRVKTDRRDAEKLARSYRSGGSDSRVGTGRQSRSVARCRPRQRGGEEGPVARAAPLGQIPVAARAAPIDAHNAVDGPVPHMG